VWVEPECCTVMASVWIEHSICTSFTQELY